MFKNPLWKELEIAWRSPEFVFVNEKWIKEIAKKWTREDFPVPSWDDPENPYDFLEFTGLATSIDFCFRDPYNPENERYFFNWNGEKYEGSYGMAVALRTAVERGIPLFTGNTGKGFIDCEFLQKLTEEDVRNIFCKDSEIPLLLERLKIFKQIGSGLESKFSCRFRNIFEKGQWTAFGGKKKDGIINILTDAFPSFFDVSFYSNYSPGQIIYFQKRAQLLLMIYQGRALAYPDNYKQIRDYELLGPPSDYELPKVLKLLGILEYHPKLAGKIDSQKIIRQHSLEEQEIRAQTINAMVRLLDEINLLRDNDNRINMLGLDYKIWSEGRNIKNAFHHLTPTIAY